MQNLFNFIIKYHFAFFFLLLQAVSFLFLVNANKFHQSGFQAYTNEISGNFYAARSNITAYLDLKKVNDELVNDNARLLSSSKNAFIRLTDSLITVNDTLYLQQYKFLGAKVVNSTFNRRNNFVIINKGSNHGVSPEMGVVNSTGIIGVVKDVSPNFSSVLSLLHQESSTSVMLKNNAYFGLLTWEEDDNSQSATLSDIPSHVNINIGDTVVTRGSTPIYPAGIPACVITGFEVIPGSAFYEIKVRLLADFHSLSYCFVIKNLYKNEQETLEAEFTEND